MPNLLFISDNASFAEDLCGQIKYYAPEFSLVEERMPVFLILSFWTTSSRF